MAIVISGGNVDTERGGQGQMFATPSGSSHIGNLDSEVMTSGPTAAPFDPMALLRSLGIQQPQQNPGFAQLGAAMTSLAQAMQSQVSQNQGGGGSFQGPPLSAGFDPNWLMTQTNAGSANGATIGGGGGGMGGGDSVPVGGMAAGWDSMTAKNFGSMKGASKLTGKGGFGSWFKGLFGR